MNLSHIGISNVIFFGVNYKFAPSEFTESKLKILDDVGIESLMSCETRMNDE